MPVRACGNKADLTKYREASGEVFAVMRQFRPTDITVERASVDEAYLDVTKAVEKMCEEEVRSCISTFLIVIFGLCSLEYFCCYVL